MNKVINTVPKVLEAVIGVSSSDSTKDKITAVADAIPKIIETVTTA
jgi:hypothetical protein